MSFKEIMRQHQKLKDDISNTWENVRCAAESISENDTNELDDIELAIRKFRNAKNALEIFENE